ncbi:DUF4965 domain-containing protein [Phototrophicus methaneseepsis]|uniref:DUF4965 domain-containing protein n=1 Tax=Phototrophicus methaneseepsis TaxID=2710758 RepID=A0A7S8EAJ5_9CHLR|nr:glutaminase family protein [Phototrophicus methaneseepsis]QPC83390.1 DUF4965 domain-containing protein [Phototrophicus methaneseepsis]
MNQLRPPAVPLVVNDPYMSVWSTTDTLTERWTSHWTGTRQTLFGMLRIDGQAYRFMGLSTRHYGIDIPAMTQTSVEVLPTRTIYQFEAAGIQLALTFVTPLLPHDLDVMSRPVTYVDFDVEPMDGQAHDVALYFDIGSDWVVNTVEQRIVWGRHRLNDRDVLWMGSTEQDILGKSGDDLRIDWGYLYTLSSGDGAYRAVLGNDTETRPQFALTGEMPNRDDAEMPRPVDNRPPMVVSAWGFDLGSVTGPVTRQLIIAYDDIFSVEYMYRKLRPYWRRNGASLMDMLEAALNEADTLRQVCQDYDAELMADMRAVGGDAFAALGALAFRQCIGGHKLTADLDGTPLFFSKENFSNGCMDTVDIFYPSSPFFLLFNPELLRGQLTPIMDYVMSPRWKFPFAPHDIGRYPLGNGQVYGGGEKSELNQMPIEECGNMLVLLTAICQVDGDTGYAERYWDALSGWAAYLSEKGLDPENQLCTDDFAGHLAHNVNLSLKAIMGIGAYAWLCEARGLNEEAASYRAQAEQMVQQWQEMADNGDHYRLTFDQADTWSQKYNIVWDKLLGLNLFPAEVAQKEIAYYKTKQGRYGLPLDNRSTYTKLDWIVWTATLAETDEDFQTFIEPVYKWMNETESRVPLNDWYYTDSGKQVGFQARPVVGGVYMPLLYKPEIWQKWLQKNNQ